jgi:hypothetical protein
MNLNFNKSMLLSLFAMIIGLCNCEAAFAAVQIQPFLCAPRNGSNASWVNIQGHRAIGITLQQSGNMAGGKFEGLSGVKGNSTVSVLTIPSSTSANLLLRLTLKTSTNQVIIMPATSRSGNTYIFNLQDSGLSSTALITHMAVFFQNSNGSPGSIFLCHFVLNGTHETNLINSTTGCLSY